ncbi:MAG TPA: hypothetical protein VHV83_13780, partial [Armatimonadota bacterium]|nr:hypothetical protein [Armatimonadota bacterium]
MPISRFARIAMGASLLIVCGMVFWGCSGSSTSDTATVAGNDIHLDIMLPSPHSPSTTEIDTSELKPPSGTEIAALSALTINAQPGGQLTIGGTAPGLQIDYGADRIADGISNLLNNLDSTSVTNNETIIFPSGDNMLSLSPDTFIGIDPGCGCTFFIMWRNGAIVGSPRDANARIVNVRFSVRHRNVE